MNKKTKGAWLIHHTKKLGNVSGANSEYEQIDFAGKCGTMLNSLANSEEQTLTNIQVKALSRANQISTRTELPAVMEELKRQRLIDQSKTGIAVLAVTSAQTLEHAATIFEEAAPAPCELAAITISEQASELPLHEDSASEYISDSYKLTKSDSLQILDHCQQIGFSDAEDIDGKRLFFNGNLFRRDHLRKVKALVGSLSSADEASVQALSQKLSSSGCLPKLDVQKQLGSPLYAKLISIGFIDESSIGNESGTYQFVTKPSAFSKFSDSMADDAFDLAKAFVTSLTFGMTRSADSRGHITMISALMRNLINGYWVGPATAIGQDYKILEMKGVIRVKPDGRGRCSMKLLKKDVGELALMVIQEGDASTTAMQNFPGVSATQYIEPEQNRIITRKAQSEPLRGGVKRLLADLRTGGKG